jgi:hypothetical protein
LISPPPGDESGAGTSYQINRKNIMTGKYDMGLMGDQQKVIRSLLLSLVYLDEELNGIKPPNTSAIKKTYDKHKGADVISGNHAINSMTYNSDLIASGNITDWLISILNGELFDTIDSQRSTLDQFIISSDLEKHLKTTGAKANGKLYFAYAHANYLSL